MPIPQLFKWSPRPDQTPEGSPASQSSSRFGALQHNVRSMINGSSVYSQSPNPNANSSSPWTTPKPPFLSFLRREHSPAPIETPAADAPRDSSDSRSPLRPQHTAGSYLREIAPLQDPREPELIYSRTHNAQERHPADVPLDYGGSGGPVQPASHQVVEEAADPERRRRRRKHRRRRHRQTQWTRRRNERQGCMPFVQGNAARSKLFSCTISGLFLITVLAIYLALALSRKDLGQEVHVLFIMIVLGVTIFFCHSLIRLCMLILHPPSEDDSRPHIPSMTGPDGFHPIRPIQVHLARDEDLSDEEEALEGEGDREPKEKVLMPPPAYGLWRSSVRVDPNLLHWQRVDDHRASGVLAQSRSGSVSGPAEEQPAARTGGPRPPSYVSDDGVSYVTEAVPRSVAPSHTGVSDIHPAWRPGYAVSEVPMDQWPRAR